MSIFRSIALGNALIIIFGAVGGTLITLQLEERTTEGWLMLLFASTGIAISLLVNSLIVRRSLRPLRLLRRQVDRLQPERVEIDPRLLEADDADIRQLAHSVDAMARALAGQNLRLRALSERSMAAQEDERRRIARSLHDDTIQAISMLIIGLQRLEQRSPDDVELRRKLAAIRDLATNSLVELRHIVYGLRPSMLDDLGLLAAIRSHARATLEPVGVRVEVTGPDDDLHIADDLAINLFRIAQEAISNVARHSGARSARIALYERGHRVWLEVLDDGHGFDVDETARNAVSRQQLGLVGIRERSELHGGEARVVSAWDRGTRVMVSFPKEGPTTGEAADDPPPAG